MKRGRRGRPKQGNNGGNGRRPPSRKEATRKVIDNMQESPHIRFLVPRTTMEQKIADAEFRQKVLDRMQKTAKWKKTFRAVVGQAIEMSLTNLEKEIRELDATTKQIYGKHQEAFSQLWKISHQAKKPGRYFFQQAKRFLTIMFMLNQIEQHRHAYEMIYQMHVRQQIDPQVIIAYEKTAQQYARDEDSCQKMLNNDIQFRKWATAQFNRLKKR